MTNQITTWNKVMFAIVVILLIMVATFLLYQHYNANGLALGQLSTGDIAQFDDEHKYTYEVIGRQVSLLDAGVTTENNSTLTNDQIQAQIMEHFIIEGIDYCYNMSPSGTCSDMVTGVNKDRTYQDNIVKREYIEIVQSHQPGPFDELLKFFGGLVVLSAYAQESYPPIEEQL
jgi:hypothetical protein